MHKTAEILAPKEANGTGFSAPELMPGLPIQPPSKRHLIASRADFEERFPVRAEILRRMEEANKPEGLSISQGELVRMMSVLARLNSLDRYVDAHRTGEKTRLRDGQMQAFESTSRFFESGGRDGYVKLPPRTGKTVLFIELVQALSLTQQGERTLIIAPSKILVEQTLERFKQFAPHLEVAVHYSEKRAIKVGSKRSRAGEERETRLNWSKLAEVTVMTRDSLRALEKKGIIRPGDFKLIIIDEAHEMLGPKTSRCIDNLRCSDTWMVGFTATPKYNEEKCLERFLGPEIHSMSVHEAVAMGLLAPFSVITAETNVDLTNVAIDGAEGYNRAEVEQKINTAALNKSVVELYLNKEFNGRSAIIFTSSVQHAKDMAAGFRAAGVTCEAIWGTKNNSEQSENERKIAAHKDGSLKVLIGPRLLGTGYDNPLVSLVVITVPFTSPVPVEQYSTRSLTPDPNDPHKVGYIVQFLHRDRNAQRRQMTFLDCIYGSRIEAFGKGYATGHGRFVGSGDIVVSGLVVTTKPIEVLKVLAKRPQPLPTHPLDDAQVEMRKLVRQRTDVLLSAPAALREALDQVRELARRERRSSKEYKKYRTLYNNLNTLKKRMQRENEQGLTGEYSSKMLYFRRATQSEAIRHFERRSEVELNLDAILESSQQGLKFRNAKLEKLLAPISKMAELQGVSLDKFLSFFDPRVRKLDQDLAWTKNITEDDLNTMRSQILAPLAMIRAWEKRGAMRWDVSRALLRELDELEKQIEALQGLDWKQSTIEFAEQRAAELIERRREKIAIEDGEDLSLEPEEIRQIASLAACQILERPKLLSTFRRFSGVVCAAIDEAVDLALKEAEADRYSFSSSPRKKDGFLRFSEYVDFHTVVAEYRSRFGHEPSVEDLAEKLKEPLGSTEARLEHSRRIQHIGQLGDRYCTKGRLTGSDYSPVQEYLVSGSSSSDIKVSPIELEELRRKVQAVFEELDEGGRRIITDRWITAWHKPSTIKELAAEFKVSRATIQNKEERIRQFMADPQIGLMDFVGRT